MTDFWTAVFGPASSLSPLGFVLRAAVVYAALLIMVRSLGQREVGRLNAFDFVVAIVIGSVFAAPLSSAEQNLWGAVAAVGAIVVLRFVNGWLAIHFPWFARLTGGEPVVLIKDGRIQEDAMTRGHLSLDALMAELRKRQIFNLEDVELAILEPTGHVTALKRKEVQPVTGKDLALDGKSQRFPAFLLREGRILRDNLQAAGLTEGWLREQLSSMDIPLEDVFAAQLSTTGQLYVDRRSDEAPVQEDVTRDLIVSQLRKAESQLQQLAAEGAGEGTAPYRELAEETAAIRDDLVRVWEDRLGSDAVGAAETSG